MTDIELMDRMRFCGHILYHRYPLNMAQNLILSILKNEGDMKQRELMDRLNVQAGSLSETLSKVEASGFITRTRCEDDKRNFELSLTPEGREKAEIFERERDLMAKELFGRLDEQRKNELFGILGELLEKWCEGLECCKKNQCRNLKGEEDA